MNLGGLDEFNRGKNKSPSKIAIFQHFFLTNGVGLREFQELPIPYILEMANTEAYIRKKENDAMKKGK